MYKLMLATALIMAVSVAAAETKPADVSSTHVLPVILKSEAITPGVCRLHFEDGTSKDISCTKSDNQK